MGILCIHSRITSSHPVLCRFSLCPDPLTFGSVPSFASFGGSAPFQSFGSIAKSDSGSFSASPSGAVQFEASSAESLLTTTDETKDEFKHRTKELTGEEEDEVHLRVPTKVYQMREVPVVTEAHPEGEVTAAAAAGSTTAAEASSSDTNGATVKTVTKYVEIGSGELHVNSVEDPQTKKTRARLVSRYTAALTARRRWPVAHRVADVSSVCVLSGIARGSHEAQCVECAALHGHDLQDGERQVRQISFTRSRRKTRHILAEGTTTHTRQHEERTRIRARTLGLIMFVAARVLLCVQFKEKSQTEDVVRALETCLDLIKPA
jgi:hypothetical protein